MYLAWLDNKHISLFYVDFIKIYDAASCSFLNQAYDIIIILMGIHGGIFILRGNHLAKTYPEIRQHEGFVLWKLL